MSVGLHTILTLVTSNESTRSKKTAREGATLHARASQVILSGVRWHKRGTQSLTRRVTARHHVTATTLRSGLANTQARKHISSPCHRTRNVSVQILVRHTTTSRHASPCFALKRHAPPTACSQPATRAVRAGTSS
ncbi:hypothetical protein TRVL_10361 [Trypanosoma vivax]|nr:hypothetical protein TRVL_10361 [Trypanosoma vivax]